MTGHPAGRQALVAALLLAGRPWQDAVDMYDLPPGERVALRQHLRVDESGRLTFHGAHAAGRLVHDVLAFFLRQPILEQAAAPRPRRPHRLAAQVLADFEATRGEHGGDIRDAAVVLGMHPGSLYGHLRRAHLAGNPVPYTGSAPRRSRGKR